MAERLRRSATNLRGFESHTCWNHSPQANSQLSCPSSRRSVKEYSMKFKETSRRPQAHISSSMVAKPLGVKWLKVEGFHITICYQYFGPLSSHFPLYLHHLYLHNFNISHIVWSPTCHSLNILLASIQNFPSVSYLSCLFELCFTFIWWILPFIFSQINFHSLCYTNFCTKVSLQFFTYFHCL